MIELKNALSIDNPETKLWDLCFDLWENKSANVADKCKTNYGYFNGDYDPKNERLKDQKKTTVNVCKRVVDVKSQNALDAQFTINVVPVLNVYATADQLSMMHDYADILNAEVHNVLDDNEFDSEKELVMRDGEVVGFAVSQTTWDTKERIEGEIKLSRISPEKCRWDSTAKSLDDCSFFAYQIEKNPIILKNEYAHKADGSYDEELCKKIDQMAEQENDKSKKHLKGVLNVASDQTASQAYVYDSDGIKSGKLVKLVCMFLLDDSVYAPEEGDSLDVQAIKNEGKMKYPNGRTIVFCLNENKKLIFEDKASPKAFKSTGNIDIFRPVEKGEMVGGNEIDDIVSVQDRINGTCMNIRLLVGGNINTVLLPAELKGICKEGDFTNFAITFVEMISLLGPERKAQILNNGAIAQAMELWELVGKYEEEAYKTAHINGMMVSGTQPTGVTSGEQLERLAESPMSAIRSLQRAFAGWVTRHGEKIVSQIQEHYTVQRLIELSTPKNGAMFARFNGDEKQRVVEMLDRAGAVIDTIKVDPNWRFRCKVTSGTSVPRSRREASALTDKIAEVMQKITDPDWLEMYLQHQDYPNYRAVVQLARQKQEAMSKKKYTIQDVLLNPTLSKSLSDFIDSLAKAGQTTDITNVLKALGLSGITDTLATAPIQAVTSRSDVKDVVAITEKKVSPFDPQDMQGREVAGAIIDNEQNKHRNTPDLIGNI